MLSVNTTITGRGRPAPYYYDNTTTTTTTPLVTSGGHGYDAGRSCYYEGTVWHKVGKAPVPTWNWFHSMEEVQALRDRIAYYCPMKKKDHLLVTTKERSYYHMVIYQRDRNRRIMNIEGMLDGLHHVSGGRWKFHVIQHREHRQPCALYYQLQNADLLLTTHGFQMMSMMFLRPGTWIFEHFPHKYYKPTYFPLAKAFGLHHYYVYGSKESVSINPGSSGSHLWNAVRASWLLPHIDMQHCMANIRCRSVARQQDVIFLDEELVLVIKVMKAVEQNVSSIS
eukprot:scaffold4041_cov189-Ochromonas_danica.AAC.3